MLPDPITSPADHIDAPPGFEGVDICAHPAAPPPPPPPSIAACVRYDLSGFAYMLARRTLARAARDASTCADWADVAHDFGAASRTADDDRWRGARAAGRAANLMGAGRVDEAAATLADFYGVDVATWHWSTADEIAKGGAR